MGTCCAHYVGIGEGYICIGMQMKRVSSVFADSGKLFYAPFMCQLLLTVGLFLSHGSSPGGGLYVGKSTTMYFENVVISKMVQCTILLKVVY